MYTDYPTNSQPTSAGFWRRHARSLALVGFGLVIAIGFLAYSGGFSALSKIFGSRAGTEFLFVGFDNLGGTKDAENWVMGDTTPATFDGTSTFTSFTGIPDFTSASTNNPGFVAPIITSLDPTANAFASHTYTSPAMNLGGSASELTKLTAYLYLQSSGDQTTVAYRTAADEATLKTTAFMPLTGTPTPLPANESLSAIDVTFPAGTLLQYFQVQVNFVAFDLAHRTAFYGISLTQADSSSSAIDITQTPDTTTKSADLNNDGTVDTLDASILLDQLTNPDSPAPTP